MPYRLKLTILFFMSSQIGFTQEIVETLTEYSEQIADEFEAHEGSDEAKDYEKQYQRRLKEEEQERRIGRQRVECIDCPSTKNIKNLVLRSSSLVNELNLSSSALRDLQFYNAIHTKVTSLGAIISFLLLLFFKSRLKSIPLPPGSRTVVTPCASQSLKT